MNVEVPAACAIDIPHCLTSLTAPSTDSAAIAAILFTFAINANSA
jgi:hypothetical protein